MTEKSEELLDQKRRDDLEKAISYLSELREKEYIFFSFDSLEDTRLLFIIEDPADPNLKTPFRTRVLDFLERQIKKMNLTDSRYSVIFYDRKILNKKLEIMHEIIILVSAVKPRNTFIIFTGKMELLEESLQKHFSKSKRGEFILGKSRIIIFPDLLETLKQKSYRKLLKEFLLQVT